MTWWRDSTDFPPCDRSCRTSSSSSTTSRFADDEQLLARPLLSVPKVAVWLLRDGRQLEAVLTHIGAWKDELTRVVREAPDEAMLFLRYISLRATERSYQEFRRVILETIPAAEAPLATIADELKQLGRQEGRQEGAVDALRAVLALQIEQRFGPLDPTVQALIAAADIDALQRALSRVAVVSDLGAVFPSH
jgi:phage gp37-like protein